MKYTAKEESIYGTLSHNININSDGDFYDLIFRMKSLSFYKKKVENDESFCLNIMMSRELRYNKDTRPSYCKHDVAYQVNITLGSVCHKKKLLRMSQSLKKEEC